MATRDELASALWTSLATPSMPLRLETQKGQKVEISFWEERAIQIITRGVHQLEGEAEYYLYPLELLGLADLRITSAERLGFFLQAWVMVLREWITQMDGCCDDILLQTRGFQRDKNRRPFGEVLRLVGPRDVRTFLIALRRRIP